VEPNSTRKNNYLPIKMEKSSEMAGQGSVMPRNPVLQTIIV
jgi:hypothetical protein